MKKNKFFIVLLLVLFTLVGCDSNEPFNSYLPTSECDNSELSYSDLPASECDNEKPSYTDSPTNEYGNSESSYSDLLTNEYDGEEPLFYTMPPYFNLPVIESPYDFRVRYFSRCRSYGELGVGGNGGGFYTNERLWIQRYPTMLENSWRGGLPNPEAYRHVRDIRVVTSVEELAEPSLTEYTVYFFENNYLVVIELTMPNSRLDELLYRISKNGTILFRPSARDDVFVIFEPSHWTIIVELDNRFRPPEFNVEFIDNPWAVGMDIEPSY